MKNVANIITSIALLLLIVSFAAIAYVKMAPVPEDSEYVGSAKCVDCHSKEHSQWSGSLHAKMMRRTTDPGVVIGNFSEDHPNIRFNLSDAVWAIGSKFNSRNIPQGLDMWQVLL